MSNQNILRLPTLNPERPRVLLLATIQNCVLQSIRLAFQRVTPLRLAFLLWSMAAGVACAQEQSPAAFREAITTPHWTWVDHHAGGTVKALFLTSFLGTREPEELAQRFDLQVDVVPVTGNPSGQPTGYDEAYLTNALAAKPDVIFVADRGALGHLSSNAVESLTRAVAGGTSLLALSPGKVPDSWRANRMETWQNEALEVVDRNLPVSRLQFPWGRKDGRIGLEVFQVGDGRFVNIGMGHGAGGGFNAFIPPDAVGLANTPAKYEIAYAIFGRLVRWAADKNVKENCSLQVRAEPALGAPVEVEAVLSGTAPSSPVSVEWEIRSVFGEAMDAGSFQIPAGADRARASIPLRCAGELTLLYRVRRDGAIVDFGALSLPVPQALTLSEVQIPECVEAGKPVTVSWSAPAHEDVGFLLQVYDADDRLVAWKRAPSSARSCVIDGWISQGGTHRLRLAALNKAGDILDEKRLPLQVRIDRATDPSRFHVMVWATEKGAVQEQWRYRRMRQLGITAFSPVGRDLDVAGMASSAGLRLAPVNICVPPGRFKKTFDSAEEEKTLEAYAKAMAPMSPLGYSLADEPGGVDLANFRDWAAKILRRDDPGVRVGYCGTHLKAGMDVPRILSSCDFMIHYSPHYLYTTDLWRGIERDLHRAFSKPDAINACYTHYAPWKDHEPYSRTMPWLLLFEEANAVSYFASAGGDFTVLPGDLRTTHETRWWSEELLELRKGVATQLIAMEREPGGVAILLPTEIPNELTDLAQQAVKIWAEALRELNVPYRFVARDALAKLDAQATPLLICPSAPILKQAEREGLDRYVAAGGTLLATAPFALHEPPVPGPAQPGFWVQPPAEQPTATPVPADAPVSLLDIASIFGVQREPGAAQPSKELYAAIKLRASIPCEVSWTTGAGHEPLSLAGRTAGDPAFAASNAVVCGTFAALGDEAPAFAKQALATPAATRHFLGKGVAYYLNFIPDANSAAVLIRRLRAESGATPPPAEVTIDGAPAPAVYLYPMRGNGTRVLGMIQDYERVPPTWENQDVKTAIYHQHGPLRWKEQSASLTLDQPTHLYDVRGRKYLGHTATATFGLRPGEPDLFAMLPYRVSGVTVKAAETVAAGSALSVRMRLVTDGKEKVGDHVVHVRFTHQDAASGEGFAEDVMLRNGQGEIVVPTAFNDRPGDWTLQVTDVLAGVRAETRVRLEAAGNADAPLPRREVRVEPKPLDWPQGEWKPYADPAPDKLTQVKVRAGALSRNNLSYGEFKGMECLQAKTLIGLQSKKADFGFTYLACNDAKKMGWSDARQIKAHSMSGLGMNRPAGHLWYYNGYIDIYFDDERVTGYRISDVREVEAGKDGRVDVTWESPKGQAVLSFGLRLDGDALLQRLLVRPAVPVDTVKVVFRSYIGGFGDSKARYVLTAAGKNAKTSDPKATPWAFYADDVEDQAYGKGMGAGGIYVEPDDWDLVQYGITGELVKKVGLQPGKTAALHWVLWLYGDLTNEEAFEAFSASRLKEGKPLKTFFGGTKIQRKNDMYRNQVAALLENTPLVFSIPLQGEDYETQIARAYDHGATHIAIGGLPFEYDALLPDNSDPYPNWSQGSFSLFRVFPPEGVAEHMPAGMIERNRAYLDSRIAAIRRHGMRIVVNGAEPLWLPESVYEAHPRWRGVQCELGRIAAKPYWTPSIDEPEVLGLYRESARCFCERYPETDRFSFWTNDCGAGLPWSAYSYPGMNGPMKYRQRDPGERIAGWLDAIRQGALDAGSEVRVNVHSFSFPPAELAAVKARLGEHLYLNNVNGLGTGIAGAVANSGGGVVGTQTNPVQGHFNRPDFVESLQKVFAPGDGRMRVITLGPSTVDEAYGFIEAFLKQPEPGVIRLQQVLLEGARATAGASGAERLLQAWSEVGKAAHGMAQLRQRGVSQTISLGVTTSRWLVCPLVPEPLKLTDEETAHYRGMLFSCDPPEENANLCNILGKPVFIGDSVVWMARWCIDEAQSHLQAALDSVDQIPRTDDPGSTERLALYRARIEALHRVCECARLAILYQHALNTAHIPRFGANPLDFDDNILFDQRVLELRKIARMDLDNTLELIELLKRFDVNEVLAQATDPAKETVFIYGPDLIDKLEKKRSVMLRHWHDYERLFPTSKRYELEPTPRDQPGRGLYSGALD